MGANVHFGGGRFFSKFEAAAADDGVSYVLKFRMQEEKGLAGAEEKRERICKANGESFV